MNVAKLVVGGAVGFVMLIIITSSMTTVETGHRGVKVRFGEVQGESLTEGLYFINPITTKIVEMDTRLLRWDGKTQAYTKDVQQAGVHFVLNYRLDPKAAHIVLRDVGIDWAQKVIGQVLFEDIKREFGQHEAVEIIGKRNQAARSIESSISAQLAKRFVVVTGFQLTNIDYTSEFERSVEAKVIAQQRAIEEQNRTVQIREQAAQKVETAKGSAEATILNAKAEAESISIRARALEQNAKLVEWEAVQKWDGKLPQYSLGAAMPFISVPTR